MFIQVSVEERLNAMGVVEVSSSQSARGGPKCAPKTDSVATLLVQGLHSEDKNMLNVGAGLYHYYLVEFICVVSCIH
jgi:hypothetical protein